MLKTHARSSITQPAATPARRSGRSYVNSAALLLLVFATARCDIPTEAPTFAVNPSVRVPLIFSEGFVLIGPNADGIDGLIDTTSANFDSLFSVNPTDRSLYISQRIDDFDLGNLDGLMDAIDVDPIDFETTIGEFESQEFDSRFSEVIGTQLSNAADGPVVPADMTGGQVRFPAATNALLEVPQTTILDLSEAVITEFEINNDGGSFNQLSFALTNNQSQTLTDGTFQFGTSPDVVVIGPGDVELLRASFPSSIAAGQTQTATLDLNGLTLPAASQYIFDVGTQTGMDPILLNPISVGIAASITETHYSAFTLETLQTQDAVDLSQPSLTVENEYDFHGAVTSDGQFTLTVTNDLPVPITIDQLQIRNVGAVGQFPAGHVVAQTSGQSIPARASSVINLPLGANGVAADLETIVFASSPGSNSPVRIAAVDAINVDMRATTEISSILIRPAGEAVQEGSTFSFDAPDISMPDPTDYVELKSGQLIIEELINELDISLNTVQLSFPGIRDGNYGPEDSLVITIPGGMPRSSIRSNVVSIDLTGRRIYATGDQLSYNLSAVSENAGDVRTINVSDKISGSIAVNDIVPRELVANIAPVNVELGTDANEDGMLDLMDDAEAQVTELGLDQLSEAGITGLKLAGAEIAFDIKTDIAADFVLFGAIVGVAEDGTEMYLGGSGDQAVSTAQASANPLSARGSMIGESDMIRLDVAGSGTIGKVVKRTVMLDENNSSITEFVGNLPKNIRFIGRAIFHPQGGKVRIQDDFLLDAGLNVSIPLAISESFAIRKDIEADLSSLADLSEPGSNFEVNQAELLLDYTNAMPLGVSVRLEFVDQNGDVLMTLPNAEADAFSISAGVTDGIGFTTLASSGSSSIAVTAEELNVIAGATTVRLNMTAATGSSGIGRIRSDDKIELSLSGNFDITVNVGQ